MPNRPLGGAATARGDGVGNGAPLAVVQKLLGHGTIEMTMCYAHVSDDALFDAVAFLKKEVKSE